MTENNDFNNIENDSHISRNEKRFKITDDGIIDTVRQKQYTKIKSSDNILDSISFTHLIEVVDLLNDLNDENEQLKNMVRHSYEEHKRCVNNYVDKIKEVEEANEQLKNEIEKIAYANEDLLKEKRLWKKLSDEYAKLYDENEQLKSEKKDMQILINTISDQRNEFHRGARENANRVGKLEKENEQLKKRIESIEKEI